MSWPEKGVNKLSKMLALKVSGKLYNVIATYFNGILPEEKLKEIKEEIELSAADLNKEPKKLKIYHVHKGGMLFE